MQETFGKKPELVAMFKKSLSQPRFGRYLSASNNDEITAIELYQWNARISQSLYIYLQSWEICLRNKINDFLVWKFKETWPYDQIRVLRNFKSDDKRRVAETLMRQERDRGVKPVPTSVVVSDLSAGFWVSQLSSGYDIPHTWRYNLARVFPHNPKLSAKEAWTICDQLLTLRNRIAHHEPVFHLPLEERREQLRQIVAAMCSATSMFSEATCNFDKIWELRPKPKEPATIA
ncbi:MAG: hypothetical protein ABIF45_23140 [Pseudomonadota bacterium]